MTQHVTSRFLARAPLAVPSFTVVVPVTGEPAVLVGDGAAIVTKEGVTVAVAGSHDPSRLASSLANTYLRAPSSFRPHRETDGSWIIIAPHGREVVFGRDRTACQHLYVAMDGRTLYLSTHLVPFISTVCRHLDPIGCDLYLASNTIAPFPLYEGISAVLPGHMHKVDLGRSSASTSFDWGLEYWRAESRTPPASYKRAVELYGELFLEGMRPYAQADEVGVLLSGGSDSACVVAGLARLGVKRIVAAHMHVEGHQDLELELVKALRDHYRFELEVVDLTTRPPNWIDFVEQSIRRHLSGSYETFPAYRIMAERLSRLLPRGAPVFNGEMCLLDQGFSDAADRWRHLKRWIYRGGGRRLASTPPVTPSAARRLAHLVGQHPSYAAAAIEGALEILHAVGRPEYFFAGMKVGIRGSPGAPRCLYRFAQGEGRDPSSQVVEKFFARVAPRLVGPDWRATAATLANAWYSETSNFTMPLTATEEFGLRLNFALSSVGLMDLAASIPDHWSRDKRIQKDMAAKVLGMPASVAYVQKDHRAAANYTELMYSRKHQEVICDRIRATDYGRLQPGVTKRLRQISSGERHYSAVMFQLYCLAIYLDILQGHQSSSHRAGAV